MVPVIDEISDPLANRPKQAFGRAAFRQGKVADVLGRGAGPRDVVLFLNSPQLSESDNRSGGNARTLRLLDRATKHLLLLEVAACGDRRDSHPSSACSEERQRSHIQMHTSFGRIIALGRIEDDIAVNPQRQMRTLFACIR